MVIKTNPEFGIELVLAIPYAYWLHQNNQLEHVVTSKGMKPFYYFCDDVEERYTERSVDNQTNGVQNLPNKWIHHNTHANFGKDYSELTEEEQIKANAWLDYSEWTPPPYKEHYYDADLDLPEKFVVVQNSYNLEHGEKPIGYFDIKCLYEIFNYLTDKGYSVIYKRPKNTEFVIDMNEWQGQDISADVDGFGKMTDFELCEHYSNVYNIDDIVININKSYNESQLKIFSRAEGFFSRGGGSSILCSYFGKPVIIYINASGDTRPGYFDKNSYFNQLSDASIYPVIDLRDDILKRGHQDYSKVLKHMKEIF